MLGLILDELDQKVREAADAIQKKKKKKQLEDQAGNTYDQNNTYDMMNAANASVRTPVTDSEKDFVKSLMNRRVRVRDQ